MRIIGDGNRDYYDTAGWANQENIFQRVAYDPEIAKKTIWKTPFLWAGIMDDRRMMSDAPYRSLSFGLCLVAGEIFPWTRLRVLRHGSDRFNPDILSTTYHYDIDEAETLIASVREKRSVHRWIRDGRADPMAFLTMPKTALERWSLDHKAATGILTIARPNLHNEPYDVAHGMINCSGLGDRELFKALDPASAHMRIDGYLSGVLPSGPETVEISDKSKRDKAGFDRISFTTRPGTKKPRRRAISG